MRYFWYLWFEVDGRYFLNYNKAVKYLYTQTGPFNECVGRHLNGNKYGLHVWVNSTDSLESYLQEVDHEWLQ
jgi:hypothetical protein